MHPEITKQEAVLIFGTQAALAKALNITRQAVYKTKDGPLPELWQMKLRYQIRPDVWSASAQQTNSAD